MRLHPAWAIGIGLCLLLSGCQATSASSDVTSSPTGNDLTATVATHPDEPASTSFFAMDTVMDVTLYGDESLLEEAEARVAELEDRFSVTKAGSDIQTLNQEGHQVLSEDTASLLKTGLDLCRRTDGALDLSIYPVLRAWGFTTEQYRVPEDEEIQALLEHMDWTTVSLNPESGEASLPPGMELDLGSVAKGYTGDQLLSLFQEAGVTSALLNLGGNVQALGTKPDGSLWRIGVRDPEGEDILGVLEAADCAVITSGGYERYFEENGVTYWHILDPATGRPARSGLISVTIVGKDGVLCDGLSTSLFVMGLKDATAFWKESSDFEAIFVTEDGALHVTEGLEQSFTPTGIYAARPLEVIRRG